MQNQFSFISPKFKGNVYVRGTYENGKTIFVAWK